MKCYHRTTVENAECILKDGFKDSIGNFLTLNKHEGVWFADSPLDSNEDADGEIVFELDIPEEVFAAREWIEEGKPYREALLPDKVVNKYGPPSAIQHDWDGCSLSDVEREANMNVDQEAGARIREVILPFLKQHNLLAPDKE